MLFKEMKLKPSVLDEYTAERGIKTEAGRECLCSDDDTLVLEDESARMSLTGAGLPVEELVTGALKAKIYRMCGLVIFDQSIFCEASEYLKKL